MYYIYVCTAAVTFDEPILKISMYNINYFYHNFHAYFEQAYEFIKLITGSCSTLSQVYRRCPKCNAGVVSVALVSEVKRSGRKCSTGVASVVQVS